MSFKYEVGDILRHDRLGFHLLVEKLEIKQVEQEDYDTGEMVLYDELYITVLKLETGEREFFDGYTPFYTILTKVA